MATIKNNNSKHISSVVNYQLPDFVQEQHPVLVDFLEKYYYFLETAVVELSGENNFIIEEKYSAINRFLYEDGSLILEEQTTKDFLVGETIVGNTSGATAEVVGNNFNAKKLLFITSNNNFIIGETVTGQTSGSSSELIKYVPNPISSIDNLVKFTDVDETLDILFNEYKKTYFKNYPNDSFGNVDQKLIIKKIKEINSLKGTSEVNRLFFNAFYNTTAETFFTRERLLKCSDGEWSYDIVLRIVTNNQSNFSNCVGQKIYTLDSLNNEISSAYISEIVNVIQSNIFITELKLEKNISGTFDDSSIVYCVDPVEDVLISGEIKNIIKTISIDNSGAYYNLTDIITIEDIGANLATASISDVGFGKIDQLVITNGGSGYKPGDLIKDVNKVNFTNQFYERYADGYVAVVGGSIILETSGDNVLLDENEVDVIVTETLENILFETSSRENEKLLLMDDGDIILEDSGSITDGSNTTGEITKVVLNNRGNGYKSLPTFTVNSDAGVDAKIIGLSIDNPKIGHLQNIDIVSNGFDFPSVPEIYSYKKLIVDDPVGALLINDLLTSHTGKIISFDSNTNLLILDSTDNFEVNEDLVFSNGSIARIIQNESSNISVTLGNLSQSRGEYISDRGKISNDYLRIQDSLYYQDFAYQLKTDISINTWRDLLKNTIHPAGWNFFGAISIDSLIQNSITTPIKLERGLFKSSFLPILLTKIIGRRLGTNIQGNLNSEPNLAKFGSFNSIRYDYIVDENEYDSIVMEDSSRIIFEISNREVTLTSSIVVSPHKNASKKARRYNPLFNIQKYAKDIPVGGDYYTIDQLSNFRLDQLYASSKYADYQPDVPDVIFRETSNIPPPSEISIHT